MSDQLFALVRWSQHNWSERVVRRAVMVRKGICCWPDNQTSEVGLYAGSLSANESVGQVVRNHSGGARPLLREIGAVIWRNTRADDCAKACSGLRGRKSA